jgi:hypothetical protein
MLLARLEKREGSGWQIIANFQHTSKPWHCASPDPGILGSAYNCDGVKIRRTRQACAIETLRLSFVRGCSLSDSACIYPRYALAPTGSNALFKRYPEAAMRLRTQSARDDQQSSWCCRMTRRKYEKKKAKVQIAAAHRPTTR